MKGLSLSQDIYFNVIHTMYDFDNKIYSSKPIDQYETKCNIYEHGLLIYFATVRRAVLLPRGLVRWQCSHYQEIPVVLLPKRQHHRNGRYNFCCVKMWKCPYQHSIDDQDLNIYGFIG